MTHHQHYRKLEQMYLNAPVNMDTYRNSSIEIGAGRATIQWPVEINFYHALGALHGSAYFKMLDDAAFFAVQSEVTDFFILTTSFNITFTRPVTGGILTARGTVRSRSKSLFTADAVLVNDHEKEVGFGTGQFMKSSRRLDDVAGYSLPS
ncbi:PaaI family thioesterase [Fulvivirga sedimenti]|uniref:PaaI family thioesterase n=1 Tax=Fulvivirga sedimenti TaxID=2879465 RepID=A0A9X1HYK8_9BACT|nr:PaaI family thioesterase [Fulvivirga sedimenti]MCA6079092.1 PaaI family thioesterase [Fulvivirga sedimenti]